MLLQNLHDQLDQLDREMARRAAKRTHKGMARILALAREDPYQAYDRCQKWARRFHKLGQYPSARSAQYLARSVQHIDDGARFDSLCGEVITSSPPGDSEFIVDAMAEMVRLCQRDNARGIGKIAPWRRAVAIQTIGIYEFESGRYSTATPLIEQADRLLREQLPLISDACVQAEIWNRIQHGQRRLAHMAASSKETLAAVTNEFDRATDTLQSANGIAEDERVWQHSNLAFHRFVVLLGKNEGAAFSLLEQNPDAATTGSCWSGGAWSAAIGELAARNGQARLAKQFKRLAVRWFNRFGIAPFISPSEDEAAVLRPYAEEQREPKVRKPLAFTRDGLLELVRKILPGHPRRQSVAVGQADFWTVHGSETSDSHAFVVELNKNHRANTPVVAVRKPREDASNRSAYSRGKRDIVIDELAKEPFVQVKGRSRWHIYHKGEGVRTLTKRQRVTLFHVVAKIGMPFPIAELGTFISESGLRGRSKYSYRPTLKKILGDELLNIVLVEGFENGKYLVPSTGWSLCWVRQFESPFDSALLHGLRSTSENAHRCPAR